jgi:signal transduction histidine kinase
MKEAGAIVDEIVSWARNFMQDIQVQELREAGLIAGVAAYIQRFSARTGVPVKFSHRSVPDSTSHVIAIAVYRIVQESLIDTVRYGPDAEAMVDLRAEGKWVFLQVCTRGGERNGGTDEGLSSVTGIMERVHLLGGDLRLDTPEKGMCLLVKLPLVCG